MVCLAGLGFASWVIGVCLVQCCCNVCALCSCVFWGELVLPDLGFFQPVRDAQLDLQRGSKNCSEKQLVLRKGSQGMCRNCSHGGSTGSERGQVIPTGKE